MENDFTQKLCTYIYTNFRPKYTSNRKFAQDCNINEKTIRLIQQGNYNMSLKKLKQICDAQNVKMSTVLKEINE